MGTALAILFIGWGVMCYAVGWASGALWMLREWINSDAQEDAAE